MENAKTENFCKINGLNAKKKVIDEKVALNIFYVSSEDASSVRPGPVLT